MILLLNYEEYNNKLNSVTPKKHVMQCFYCVCCMFDFDMLVLCLGYYHLILAVLVYLLKNHNRGIERDHINHDLNSDVDSFCK